MSQSPFAWTPPREDSLVAGYILFLRESTRRLEHACNRLEPEWLDRTPAEGMMTVRELLVHCNGLIQFASSKAIGEDMSAPSAQIDNAEQLTDITAAVLAAANRFILAVEDRGLLLPLEEYALKPINDLGHHAGQIAIFPRLFNKK